MKKSIKIKTNTLTQEERIKSAQTFFNSLYTDNEIARYGYLWIKKADEKSSIYFNVSDKDERRKMAEKAIEYADIGNDVYSGICTLDSPLDKHHRAKKNIVTGTPAVWCDIDIQGGEHQSNVYPTDFNTAQSFLPITPTLLINSGYGLHGYWLFKEFQIITDKNRDEAEQLNKDFLSVIRHNAKNAGFPKGVDAVQDLARVLRVPGTFNYKMGKDNAPLVRIVNINIFDKYTISDFRSEVRELLVNIPPESKNKKTKEEKKSKSTSSLCDLDLYNNTLVYISDDEIIERICNSKQGKLFAKLFYEGDISDYNNDNSSADMALMSILPFWTKGNAEQMERIFNRSALALRDKWNERTDYRQMTINNALTLWNGEFYKADYQRKELNTLLERSDNGKILPTAGNFFNIITYDQLLSGLIAEDKFSGKTIKTKAPPWGTKNDIGKSWSDKDDAQLRFYIDQNYGLRSQQLLNDVIIIAADNNAFHPVLDYLKNLPSWDGIPRAETFFIETLGVEDSEYSRSITLYWLLAAIKRVMVPGCKFDYCLVLAGSQGIGKSTVLEKLGVNWFNNSIDSINGKDALEQLQGSWIVELGEMQATKKADNEAIKNFISRSIDKVRLPYAKRAQDFPRQCVFSATTNDSEPLKDKTGGRRFWILKSVATSDTTSQRLAILSHYYIQQLWAEVFQKYKEKLSSNARVDLLPPVDILTEAARLQEEFTEGNEMISLIQNYLDKLIPDSDIWNKLSKNERRNFIEGYEVKYHNSTISGEFKRNIVCSAEIAFEIFNIEHLNKEKMTLREINTIMANLKGWHKESNHSVRMGPYGSQKNIYVRDGSDINDL